MLNKIRASLKYKCPSEHIPQKIEVDISNLDIGDRVFMRDVKVHPSLELLSKNDSLPVCKIVAAKLDSTQLCALGKLHLLDPLVLTVGKKEKKDKSYCRNRAAIVHLQIWFAPVGFT
ncbi:hypothetical protein E3N88_06792 [Mikania micrantha]|uniref:Large ribosomal subunit protein bL25 beta domain-containing protein n=1 Tax=Mikania micrantha TaxID=192012 RepID=A0A5N6PQZ4_9ASTR|nr:hypothetical protein E3N88_06792 [Mikania micrantha]